MCSLHIWKEAVIPGLVSGWPNKKSHNANKFMLHVTSGTCLSITSEVYSTTTLPDPAARAGGCATIHPMLLILTLFKNTTVWSLFAVRINYSPNREITKI